MERPPNRDPWLYAVCGGRMLFYSVFMVAAACLPVLRVEWGMTATQAGTVAAGFSFGYAVSLLVYSWLAARVGAKRVFLASACLSTLSALAFGFFARSYASALVLYTLAALMQGGLYTPAIMLFADRYAPARRGSAVGWLIGSNTVGYGFSVLMAGAMLAVGGYQAAFVVAGLLPLPGLVVCWLALRDTANVVRPRPVGGGVWRIMRANAQARRLVTGYTFHCWELLSMWAWLPAFLAAGLGLAGAELGKATQIGAYLTAVIHLAGSLASWSMGTLSDRLGRRAVLLSLAILGAAFSMTYGWLVAWPTTALLIIGLAYTFVAVGDSPVLSTALTEAVDPASLGSMLALRALVGFGAGAVGPIAFGAILDATNPPGATPEVWGWAFMAVGLGGLGAAWCAFWLRR
jgi:MFS family permease